MNDPMSFDIFWQIIQVALIPILGWFVYEVRETRKSIVDLNLSVAISIQRISNIESDYGRRVTKIEDRLEAR